MSQQKVSPILEIERLLLPEIERLLLPGFFRNVPVDCLFVVNTFKNIQIVQSFSDDRLQR